MQNMMSVDLVEAKSLNMRAVRRMTGRGIVMVRGRGRCMP